VCRGAQVPHPAGIGDGSAAARARLTLCATIPASSLTWRPQRASADRLPESSRSTRRKADPFSRSSDCSPTRRQLKVRGTSGCRTVPVATHGYPRGWLTIDG
jgi:hypothetical protein